MGSFRIYGVLRAGYVDWVRFVYMGCWCGSVFVILSACGPVITLWRVASSLKERCWI